ncbi:short-chain dehydrogenase/reductase SDR [Arcobacter nitrofigilis DSM 7299]|uniref:Short-chain dehydrogenase/reductase SDR n=1 Tax=Arcobacter nitrofigilis (strain ATCC 33309 / DSM 7299 / CCUG 15893 / LMG 7604 / NCTC 12251 / CI) TaxID=572480 RepID=D5UZF4_ARCNC|nr:SDR family NAD(P)-dependent oxidoreductase [Arcobacter nitrofigilis]ADG92191.1 short-chain dehydrogenase/reductase SDR [Arcobacter nitrofigilis DSM 7299]
MKAIVTGYSSGIGKAISDILENNAYEVIKLKSRLNNFDALEKEIKSLLKENDINILVNCAGVGIFKPHEEISLAKIKELIDVNLTAPIILSNLLLRSLKKTKGHIINVASIEATRHSKFSALYTATKSGLRDFGLALFEELRRSDVKVTTINPDLTKTNFFDDFNFEPGDSKSSYLIAEDIAKSVLEIINYNGVITDITIRPQKLEIKKKI